MRERRSVEKRYAEFHALYTGDFKRDVAIYKDLAAKFEGPVLDVGCGTGRVMAHLASSGHDVLGIDTSRAMLEVAVEYLKPWADRTRLVDLDLRHHAPAERFSVALAPLFTFNGLIDIEEQRLFLRHLRRSLASPGIVACDMFCPITLVRPEESGRWRELNRVYNGRRIHVSDCREMLTPLLERRIQKFHLDDEPVREHVSHRRYVPPLQAARLFEEAGFENVQWVQRYDLGSAAPIPDEARPSEPYMVLATA
jgi:SAM-dependent methyltransferase